MSKRYTNDELALLFQRTFSSQDGQDVLHVLEQYFEQKALTPNAAVDGMALALMTQHRIGEHNVVKFIKSQINRKIGEDHDNRNDTN